MEAAARTTGHGGDEPGDRLMTRYGPFARTTTPSRRRSTGCHVHITVAPVIGQANTIGTTATGSAAPPASRFVDTPSAPYETVCGNRWHPSKHKSP